MPDDTPPLHPDIAALTPLLGAWEGSGHGEYPTIDAFDFGEHVTFGHIGKPFVAYTQRTWALDDRRRLHAEAGYWRVPGAGRIELVLAHPTGIAEVDEGSYEVVDGMLRIELASTVVGRTASAKEVTRIERSFRLDGDQLDYTVRMAAVGEPITHHLAASLQRVAAP